ncbi:MAG: SgcJ/EcaC family oxidoreductase [Acidobacteria bacterium]|nr:SgcJ/EcaC family oxidoreductase [Acidobacteriota bacterium]
MLRALPLFFAAALYGQAPAPSPAPLTGNLAIVQRQMDAYNAHDAQAYAACFTPDIQFIRHPGIAQIQGRDELYKTFATVFRSHKSAKMRVIYRAELGPNTVIEHQEVDGIEKHPVPSLVIYSLQGGLIQAAWFVMPE